MSNFKTRKIPVAILSAFLGVLLVVSCIPVIDSGDSIPDTGDAAETELPLDPADDHSASSSVEPSPEDGEGAPESSDSPLPITRTEDLNRTGTPPEEVNIATYEIYIEGLVDNPLSLSYQDILAYSDVTEVVKLICPGVFQDNAEWTGVPVWVLLEEAGIKPEAKDVMFRAMVITPGTSYGRSSYSSTPIPLEEIIGNDSIFLAHTVNGQILPLEHGYPIRLVAKDRFGYDWVKWLEIIEVR